MRIRAGFDIREDDPLGARIKCPLGTGIITEWDPHQRRNLVSAQDHAHFRQIAIRGQAMLQVDENPVEPRLGYLLHTERMWQGYGRTKSRRAGSKQRPQPAPVLAGHAPAPCRCRPGIDAINCLVYACWGFSKTS